MFASEAIAFRVTDAITTYRPAPTLAAQIAGGAPVSYGRFLTWRGLLTVEPPRRPEPARPSSSAAARNADIHGRIILDTEYVPSPGGEANAAMRSIVRRDTGERYEEFLMRLAKESGIDPSMGVDS